MPFVKFTQDRSTVEAQPQHFKAGEVYELPAASCERWIRRGAAIDWNEKLDATTLMDAEPVLVDAPKTKRRKV